MLMTDWSGAMKSFDELRNETIEAIRQFKMVYGDRTSVDDDLLTPPMTLNELLNERKR